MLFALDEINNNHDLLPNTTIGALVLDSCSSDTYALDQTMEFVRSYMNQVKKKVKKKTINYLFYHFFNLSINIYFFFLYTFFFFSWKLFLSPCLLIQDEGFLFLQTFIHVMSSTRHSKKNNVYTKKNSSHFYNHDSMALFFINFINA